MFSFASCLLFAVLLDAAIGDPVWAWHPVRRIGALCAALEPATRRRLPPRLAGVLTVALVLTATALSGLVLFFLTAFSPGLGWLLSTLLLYTCIAAQDLLRHTQDVYEALIAGPNLEPARERVGRIVGRDTAALDAAGISKAAVESIAENMSDGVVAPLFYAALCAALARWLGLPGAPAAAAGALLYKAVNTMDSMFGYKNERYLAFGWAPARLDDLANLLPARLSALCIVAAAPLCREDGARAWAVFVRDRLQHSSPNAGNPEAAMAGALGVQLGGPSDYFGARVDKPTLGDATREIVPQDILRAQRLMRWACAIFVGLCLLSAI